MTLRKNILANFFGMGAVALGPIIALPWYLEALGPKLFGLISFMVMLQAVLSLVDAGMSQALVRETTVRLDSTVEGKYKTASLLFSFERIYWSFSLVVGCLTLLLANIISTSWLNLESTYISSGKYAVYGAAIIFAFQLPGSLYRSILVGAQEQVILNKVMFGAALVRHVGGVLMVLIWPVLPTYLIWHASIALMETLLRRRFSWSKLNVKRNLVKRERKELRPVLKLVASMSGVTWLGALTVQMDKIVLSKMAPIEQLGYYTIAATVSVGALQLIYPLIQAVLPRVIQLRDDPVALYKLNIKLLFLIGVLAGVGVITFFSIGEWLLGVWLRDSDVVRVVYPLLAILLLGTCLNAFYNIGYINWIAHEKINRVFQVNAIALLLSIIFIPLLITWQGTIGAAFGWLAINMIGLVLSLEWLKWKRYERNN